MGDKMMKVLQGSITKVIRKEKVIIKEITIVKKKIKESRKCISVFTPQVKDCKTRIVEIRKEIEKVEITISNLKVRIEALKIEYRKEIRRVCQKLPTTKGAVSTIERIIELVKQIKSGELQVVVKPHIVKMLKKYIVVKKHNVVKVITVLKTFISTSHVVIRKWKKVITQLRTVYTKTKKVLKVLIKAWKKILIKIREKLKKCQIIYNFVYDLRTELATTTILLKNAHTHLAVYVELKNKDIPRLSKEIGHLHDLIVMTKKAMREVVCKTTSGQTCVFPFRVNGVLYDKCIVKDSDGRKWCATMIAPGGNFNGASWGYCEPACEPKTARVLLRQRLAAVFGTSHSIVVAKNLEDVIKLLEAMIKVLDGSRNKLYRIVKDSRKRVTTISKKVSVLKRKLKIKAEERAYKTEIIKYNKRVPAVQREIIISRNIITYSHGLVNGTVSASFKFPCRMLRN